MAQFIAVARNSRDWTFGDAFETWAWNGAAVKLGGVKPVRLITHALRQPVTVSGGVRLVRRW